MRIELITTGSELMLGRVLNTHQQWLCRQLADRGYEVDRQVAVPDTGLSIQAVVREALERADLVIVTGGLGPTSDDRTRDLIADLLGLPLIEDAAIVAHIENMFRSRNRPMPAQTRVQAMVPRGAEVLTNRHGTAPGLAIRIRSGQSGGGGESEQLLIMLPGPPRELRPMFSEQVVALIERGFPLGTAFVCRTLKTAGLGESMVEERIAAPLQHLVDSGLELGYCARTGEVDVRFVARGCGADAAVAEAEQVARRLLGGYVFGVDDDSLEVVVIRRLSELKQSVGTAESCTGGFIAHRLTNVPGASEVFFGGVVAYSNRSKEAVLGVAPETLRVHGAVSEEVVREMAAGARARLGTDHALAVTGIAGPGGGTPEKPVGTVFIGLATGSGVIVEKHLNRYERETFKSVTSQQALALLRRNLPGAEDGVGVLV